MELIDDLYQLYRDQLVGDEEDALIIVSGVLEELEKQHFLELIQKMSRQEIYEMLGRYLVERLQHKMAEEGIGHHDGGPPIDGQIH